MAETLDASLVSDLDISELASALRASSQQIQSTYQDLPPETLSSHQGALLDAAAPDLSVAFLDTLERGGIDNLTVNSSALQDPEAALPEILSAGQAALQARGLPDPDVQFYRDAADVAQVNGQDYFETIADMQAQNPLMMRTNLLPVGTIDFMDTPETLGVTPPIEGPVAETVEPTQYDVHMMGFPIKTISIGGLDLPSSASHGFIVITERGLSPMEPENAKLSTRGGPDHRAGQTMVSPDSTLPDDVPSATEKTDSGNVYISNNDDAYIRDTLHEGRFHVRTIEVDQGLDSMTEIINRHAETINFADIDYEVLNRNSNTYYGDITEILTGQEPPDFSFAGGVLRYFPAINNDLMDYSNSEFSEYFEEDTLVREPVQAATTDQLYGLNQEESYDDGL